MSAHITSRRLDTTQPWFIWALHPVSFVLELTGFPQCIFNVLYFIRARKCAILQLCNTSNLWIQKYNGFLLQLPRCWVITVGYIIQCWFGPQLAGIYLTILVWAPVGQDISYNSGLSPSWLVYILQFWFGPQLASIYAVYI